jgi:hypothetical protein
MLVSWGSKMTRQIYASKDQPEALDKGYFKIDIQKAEQYNSKGYGIFWTVNEFDGPRRKVNLKTLNSWYVEMELEEKPTQMSRLELSPVPPSLIVESKRGYHVYWNCRDATLTNYKRILKGLRQHFKADENAQDVTRCLRVPGFNHVKDLSDPFPVQIVWEYDNRYSERLMMFSFVNDEEDTPKAKYKRELMVVEGSDFWSKAMSLDCELALKRLSGTRYVQNEHYTFRDNGNGTNQIYVNGKSTSCWIDSNRKIGSSSKGGPGIAQWLHWHGHSYPEVRQILIDVFPEVG